MTPRRVLAIVAHPDDIEFTMAGTLLLLRDRGWEIHCINVADGCCGSMTLDRKAAAACRWNEAQAAATSMGATLYPPLAHDLEITYSPPLLKALAAVVRRAKPSIILTHSPEDYMEDHMITCRLAVTAAFARAMPNFPAEPETPAWSEPVALYHALPHGLADMMGRPVRPDFLVDTATVLEGKENALACHKSQKEWLDQTQGMDSYLAEMRRLSARTARWSPAFQHAEGWRPHNPLGFAPQDFRPLQDALADHIAPASDTPRPTNT